MADEKELSVDFGNFGIENTMEMGLGNQELLTGLLEPETSTADPNSIKKVDDEPPVKKKAPEKKTVAAAPKKQEDEDEDEGQEKAPKQKSLAELLLEENEEEEEETTTTDATTAKPIKKEEGGEEEGDGEEEPAESRFSALAKDLVKLGVFSQEEGEEDIKISSPEEFLERFQVEKKKGAIQMVDDFIGQFGDDYKAAFEAIYVKGVSPKDYFGAYNNIENFAELDLSQESNQVAVLKQVLADQGYEGEDLDAKIEKIKNYGDLEEEAGRAHKVLIKKEAANLQKLEKESQAKLQQLQASKQQYVQNVTTVLQEKLKTKEFDGIPINPKLATEIQDFLLRDKYKTPTGETLTEFDKTILELKRPENHATKVKLALLLKILEKDPTLSTIQKTGITKKSNELFSEVARQTSKSSAKSSKEQPKSWFA